MLKPRDPDTLSGWLDVYKEEGGPAAWPTNTGETVGGCFEEVEAVKEELLETLRAGPGEAARREVAVGVSGPAPSRWTLRTIRASVEWLTATR